MSGPAPHIDWEAHADLVVVGGGVAGLTAARVAAQAGLAVLTLSKGGPANTATQYAQGGIAIVRSGLGYGSGLASADALATDSVGAHVADTCAAGAGLCDEAAVCSIVADGERALYALTELGAVFDRGPDGDLDSTREGGHSERRIIHAGGDATGAEVQRALGSAGVPVVFDAAVLRVLTDAAGVTGVLARTPDGYGIVHAPSVLLATGGLGQLYTCSTNPEGATADGIALALDAGATVADMEFVQFHPTVLFAAGGLGRRPLISEAVRGEGAILVDADGKSVTAGAHPMGDLAPRDIVSRAIATRLRESGADHVYLDARALSGFHARFPTITDSCAAVGLDPSTDLIPVAPAAHYACGGVVTDVHGQTIVPGLLAAGEVARTGLHGANRLASNSLLEGLVVGERAGRVAVARAVLNVQATEVGLRSTVSAPRARLQELMTTHASVVRDGRGLASATTSLAAQSVPVAPADVTECEDAALTLAATAILMAASLRTESRGCHTRLDHPETNPRWQDNIELRMDADGQLRTPELAPAGVR